MDYITGFIGPLENKGRFANGIQPIDGRSQLELFWL